MKTYIRDDGCIESGWFVPAGNRRIDLGAYPESTLLRLSASAPDFPGTVLRFDIVTGAHFRHVDDVSAFEAAAREWAPRDRRLAAMSDLRAETGDLDEHQPVRPFSAARPEERGTPRHRPAHRRNRPGRQDAPDR